MKIGIITWYKVDNYGAALLAYAMQRVFEGLGHQVVFLRYTRKTTVQLAQINSGFTKLMRFLRNQTPNRIASKKCAEKKSKAFQDFRDKYLSIGDYYNRENDLDIVVVGSDQIFDCKYEYNEFQYGKGVKCNNVIAYAPSFGETNLASIIDHVNRKEIQESLLRFRALSSRDENTFNIINHLTGNKPAMVIDPVLLYGFASEKTDWNQKIIDDSYLLVYAWGGTTGSKEFAVSITNFARKNRLRTVSVGDRRPWCDYNFASASPKEFFQLFSNTSMVITNMFHGTCFSILLNKPFYSLAMPHNKNKLEGLLQQFNLQNQIIYDVKTITNVGIPSVNFAELNKNIELEQSESMKYLCKVLG